MTAVRYSGLHERRPEDLRKELMDLVVPNRSLFAGKEYAQTLKALIQMEPHQFDDYKSRIEKTIIFRQKHKITNAGTGQLF